MAAGTRQEMDCIQTGQDLPTEFIHTEGSSQVSFPRKGAQQQTGESDSLRSSGITVKVMVAIEVTTFTDTGSL
jgi:hypothetical protein